MASLSINNLIVSIGVSPDTAGAEPDPSTPPGDDGWGLGWPAPPPGDDGFGLGWP